MNPLFAKVLGTVAFIRQFFERLWVKPSVNQQNWHKYFVLQKEFQQLIKLTKLFPFKVFLKSGLFEF